VKRRLGRGGSSLTVACGDTSPKRERGLEGGGSCVGVGGGHGV
jgi:hypothetical protein